MSFTPGPWHVKRAKLHVDDAFDFAISADGVPVLAEAFGRSANGGRPDAEANANLIAAAPDLLSALKEARDELWRAHQRTMSEDEFHSRYKAIDAAISKVIGGSK